MGVLEKLKRFFPSINKQTNNEVSNHYADGYYGQKNNLLSIDEMLGLTYITKSIQMIAQDVAKVAFVQKKHDIKTNRIEVLKNTRLHWMLNRKPSSDLTGYNFKSLLVWNLFLYQKAVVYCHYEKINDRYYLTELIPIYPEYAQKFYDEKNNVYYEVALNGNSGEKIRLSKNEIIWMEYAIINNVYNVSLRALFKSTFAKLKENEAAILNAIKNDTGVSMLINVPDITDKEIVNNVQTSIDEMVARQKRYGSIAMVKDRRWTIEPNTNVIESKIDYTTRNAIAREVAAVFGIPASKLGIEDNNKYNTLIERNRSYVDNAVKPILDIITNAFTDFFFETDMTQEITYRAIDLLSLDPGALKDFATSAINNAFATPNEIRQLIGWEPVEEGDTLMANGAIVPIKGILEKQKLEIEQLRKNINYDKKEGEKINDNNEDNSIQNNEVNRDPVSENNDSKTKGKKAEKTK